MAYSLDQLSTMMDTLAGRVTVLDGVGLTAPAQGQVPVLTARVNGQDTKIRSVVTNLQAQLTKLGTNITGFMTMVRGVLTLPSGS